MRCVDLFVKSLEFVNFRNLENSIIEPIPGINVICGENAQGKTNMIECLWLFTGGRSFRGAKESEMIRFGEKQAIIRLVFNSEERDQTIEINISGKNRKAVLNDVPKNYLSEIVGKFCAVVFSPNHLSLIKNGPEERRSFIDGAICQTDPRYASVLGRYKRTLNERNALLKDIPRHRELEDMLDIWNEKLSEEGAEVSEARAAYVECLKEPAVEFYNGISSGREEMSIEYRSVSGISVFPGKKEMKRILLESLEKKQKDDIYCGYTTSGVHRDDLIVKINNLEARSFGSQGQQRSAILSLKLAEASVLKSKTGETPVILLDDVLSELDRSRQEYLLNKLDNMQVFITCCEDNVRAENLIHISRGRISEKNDGE